MKRLRVSHLRFFVPFILLAWRASLPIGDNSFLWHVRAGTLQLDQGNVLTTDVFSFTAAGEAWRTQSWLAELGYGWLENLTGGIGWVPAMKFLAMSLTVALLALVVHNVAGRRSGVTLAGLLLLVWQAAPFGIARPALLGFVLLASVVAFSHLERRPLWLLPLLFWFWASVHGMFVVGLGYLFLDAMRRRSRRQVVAVVISGVATAFTAHGLGAWWILLQFGRSRGALDLIREWLPPDFSNPFLLPLLVVIIGIMVAGTLGRLSPDDLWIMVPFVAFGLLAERNVWPAVIVLVPLAAVAFNKGPAEPRALRPEPVVVNWVIAALLIAVAFVGLSQEATLNEDRFPVAAAVAALEPGPLFNGSAVGGFLIYDDWPEHHVFIDDRAELYGEAGFQRFQDLKSGIGVHETFAELDIQQAIINVEWPLVGHLELLGWQYGYEDEFFVVMSQS
ncbi:MAG: hypothetical protein GY926_07885 [bacterium]|nr:hypothetical protein [bacterium]